MVGVRSNKQQQQRNRSRTKTPNKQTKSPHGVEELLSCVVVLLVSEVVSGSHISGCFYGADTVFSKFMLHFYLVRE